jgi:SRSO17 transposase
MTRATISQNNALNTPVSRAGLRDDEAARERFAAFSGVVLKGALARRDQREKGLAYIAGLLGEGGKNMEAIGWRVGFGVKWQNVQNLVTDNPWSSDPVWNATRALLAAEIEPDATVIDETTLPKSGRDSVAVARQYSGYLGKIGNCQMLVSSHLSGAKGSGMVGSLLYVPREWINDAARRERAKIPATLQYANKQELAKELLARQRADGLGHLVVLADIAYGGDAGFRLSLEAASQPYVLEVKSDARVHLGSAQRTQAPYGGFGTGKPQKLRYRQTPRAARTLARQRRHCFRDVTWKNPLVGNPGGGKHTSQFAVFPVRQASLKYAKAYTRQGRELPLSLLLVEWPKSAKDPVKYWLSSMPVGTPIEKLVELAKRRYRVEQDYRELKGELGLDEFQGRSFHGLLHHVAFCAAAHAFLTLERLHGWWRAAFAVWSGPRCSYSVATVKRFLQGALSVVFGGGRTPAGFI